MFNDNFSNFIPEELLSDNNILSDTETIFNSAMFYVQDFYWHLGYIISYIYTHYRYKIGMT